MVKTGRGDAGSKPGSYQNEMGSIMMGDTLRGSDLRHATANQETRGPRDDLFAAMPPLEAKQASLVFLAGMREKRRWSRLEVRGRFHVTLKSLCQPKQVRCKCK